MTRKIITGVIAAVLVVTIAVLAAEKAKEKAFADRPGPKEKAGERGEGFEQHEGLLDQLAEAYKANDREKMGEIINKMQERREKMREFVKANRWHQWVNRRMMGQMSPSWGRGQQMAGPGWNRGGAMRGPGSNQGCPMAMAGPRPEQFEAMEEQLQAIHGQLQALRHGFGGYNNMMGNYGAFAGPQNEAKGWGCGPGFYNGMGNCGRMAGGCEQMPCQQGGMGMGNSMQQQNGPGQMPGWERDGFRKNFGQEQNGDDMGPRGWNMPRLERNNVPPPEWGW